MTVEMSPDDQWCEEHWAYVLSTIEGPIPINGILATIRIFTEWMTETVQRLGDEFPDPDDADAIMALVRDAVPLCCTLGDERLGAIYSTCVVPTKYRRLHPRIGHMLHMQEEAGALIVGSPEQAAVFGASNPSLN